MKSRYIFSLNIPSIYLLRNKSKKKRFQFRASLSISKSLPVLKDPQGQRLPCKSIIKKRMWSMYRKMKYVRILRPRARMGFNFLQVSAVSHIIFFLLKQQ